MKVQATPRLVAQFRIEAESFCDYYVVILDRRYGSFGTATDARKFLARKLAED